MASTPSLEDFLQVAKVAGLGVVLIGAIGFAIFVIMSFLPGTYAGAVVF